MPKVFIPSNNRGLISTFGNYYNRSSTSFSGILGTATYPQRALSSLNINYYTVGSTVWYINIATSNPTKGTVSITSPWGETSSGTTTIGNNRQAWSGGVTNIFILCTVSYGYTFTGWYTLPSGGTLITSTNALNVNVNNPMIDTVWYAQFA